MENSNEKNSRGGLIAVTLVAALLCGYWFGYVLPGAKKRRGKTDNVMQEEEKEEQTEEQKLQEAQQAHRKLEEAEQEQRRLEEERREEGKRVEDARLVSCFKEACAKLHTATEAGNIEALRSAAAEWARLRGLTQAFVREGTNHGNACLYSACQSGHGECVAVLLNVPGVDANAVGSTGKTPLCVAASNGMLECVKALVGHPGVDLTKGLPSPLNAARDNDRIECADVLAAALCIADMSSLPSSAEEAAIDAEKFKSHNF